MKYLLIGLFLSLCGVLISIILWGMEKSYLVSGTVGCIFIVISMIFSGAMVSGDRMRANFATETTDHRDERNKFTLNSLYIAIPNIVVAVLFYYLNK
ncbi:DUF5316 domain-containing protein [Lysinibacillus sp. Bpr_S20]|uniref:DUF5316 domain-containing protein n=1 Tax=Lysinibacillus sp. Bpr_S20 TaxID=2933964 RepID=UPI002013A72E|nr:DUF5316 domain-containing protein [Lysinibacillus sp. Bpr_S20]